MITLKQQPRLVLKGKQGNCSKSRQRQGKADDLKDVTVQRTDASTQENWATNILCQSESEGWKQTRKGETENRGSTDMVPRSRVL
jgi:hypothetical protein